MVWLILVAVREVVIVLVKVWVVCEVLMLVLLVVVVASHVGGVPLKVSWQVKRQNTWR